MTDLSELRFFQTAPHTCSYLPDEQASNVFIDPEQTLDSGTYSFLSSYGFRRSGSHVYKPRCSKCQACLPLRIPTDTFVPTRSQLRCLKRNNDLTPVQLNDIQNDECYSLYERYISGRHKDGDMYPPSYEQYCDFLSNEWGVTRYIGFRDIEGKLISVAVIDCLHNGLSAMYSFFDPDFPKRSLGVFNILYQILWARDIKLPFVYLGYYIKNSPKMHYKREYKPYQLFINEQWITYENGE